jgi:LacI family transcriptional regulator
MDHILEVCEGGTPVVLFDRVALPDKLSSVTIDDSASAYQATRYLIESGSGGIAFLGGANTWVSSATASTLYPCAEGGGVGGRPQAGGLSRDHFNAGLVDTLALLEAQPDALLAMNDTLAFAAMEAIKSRGMVIPDDIRLIGYTDETHANYLTPKLTAVRHNTRLIGEQACRLLLEQIGGDTAVRHITVPTHLEIRRPLDTIGYATRCVLNGKVRQKDIAYFCLILPATTNLNLWSTRILARRV